MNSAESLIIWFLVGTFAFFAVGFSWVGTSILDLWKKRGKKMEPIDRSNISEDRNGRINRCLIARFDLIEQLLSVAEEKGDPGMVEQVEILRKDFLFMLTEFSLHPFEFEKGDKITIDDRKRILLVDQASGSNEVTETVNCGFVYQPEGEEASIVRKAAIKLG